MLDEHGFGHDCAGAAGPREPRNGRQQMQKQHDQIAHRLILQDCDTVHRMLTNLGIRQAQAPPLEQHCGPLHVAALDGAGRGHTDFQRLKAASLPLAGLLMRC